MTLLLSSPFMAGTRLSSVSNRFFSSSRAAFTRDMTRFVPTSGTYPKGFLAAGVETGVKKAPADATSPRPLDLSLVVSSVPETTHAAAVFTKNLFRAAPVLVSQKVLADSAGRGVSAVVVNSGCANAVTGTKGMENAWEMSKATDDAVSETGDGTARSLVMSTGVIGQHLQMPKIVSGIRAASRRLGSDHDSWLAAAKGIITTDTFPKLGSRVAVLPSTGTEYRLCGFSKGAGMIHPNMATMLALVATDAPVCVPALKSALAYAVERSFNSITVDGDTSTNDTLVVMANGACLEGETQEWIEDESSKDYVAFRDVLTEFTGDLAKLIVRDGEGATKFVTIRVKNAPSYALAHKVATTIATSSLFKTALYGKDANWGRILCAVGYTEGIDKDAIDPKKVSLYFWNPEEDKNATKKLQLLTMGEPEENIDEDRASEILEKEEVGVCVDLGQTGPEEGKEAVVWTCDLSHEYVTINGSYRS